MTEEMKSPKKKFNLNSGVRIFSFIKTFKANNANLLKYWLVFPGFFAQ